MGFNSRFTTKPAVTKSGLITPPKTKPFVKSVDEYEVKEHSLPRPSDWSRQSEHPMLTTVGSLFLRFQDWQRRRFPSWLRVPSYCFYLVLYPRHCPWVLSVDRRSCLALCSSVKLEVVAVVDAKGPAWLKSEANATVATLIMFWLTRSATVTFQS